MTNGLCLCLLSGMKFVANIKVVLELGFRPHQTSEQALSWIMPQPAPSSHGAF